MAITVEELDIVIDLNAGPLEKNTQKAQKTFDKSFKKMNQSTNRLNIAVKNSGLGIANLKAGFARLAGAMAGAFGIMKAFNATMQSFENKDVLGKTADKLGITTQALVSLRLAAEQTAGVTSGVLDTAIQRMVRRISEAKEGFGEAKGALRELGIDIEAIGNLSPDKQFSAIAEAMSQVSGQGDRVRLAMKLFDTEGVALVNTLKGGESVLDAFAAKAELLGTAVSRLDAAKAEVVNDAFSDMKAAIQGIFNVISDQLAPAFFAFAETATKLAIIFRQNQEGVSSFGDTALAVVAGVMQVVHGLVVAWEGVKLAIAGIKVVLAEMMRFQFNIITDMITRIQGFAEIVEGVMEDPAGAFRLAWFNMQKTVQEISSAILHAFSQMIIGIGNQVAEVNEDLGGAFKLLGENVRSVGLDMDLAAIKTQGAINDMANSSEGLKKVANGFDKLTASFDPSKMKDTGIDLIDNFVAGINASSDNLQSEFSNQFGQLLQTANAFGGKSAFEFVLGMKNALGDKAALSLPEADTREQPTPEEDERVIREKMVQDELTRLNQERIDTERKDFVAQQTFWQSSLQNRLSTASSIFGDLATLMQSKSKKIFEIGKIAAISQAVVDTYASANKAMSTLPYPLNLAAAAATTAAGFVNVQNIRSQQFSKGGSKGGGASGGGSSIGAVGAEQAPPQNNTTFNVALQGQSFGGQQVRSLINQINDGTDDNVTLNVSQRVD